MSVDFIRDYCLSFPEATENLQWGEDLCFKVRGKIFATLALSALPQQLCFKCTPEVFAELIERPGIRPAPYVGRYHWVMLDGLDVLSRSEVTHLIRESYSLVAEKAPKRPKTTKAGRRDVTAKRVRGRPTSRKSPRK